MIYNKKSKTDTRLRFEAFLMSFVIVLFAILMTGGLVNASAQHTEQIPFHTQVNQRMNFLNEQGFNIDVYSFQEKTKMSIDNIYATLRGENYILDDELLKEFCKVILCDFYRYTNENGMKDICLIPFENKRRERRKIDRVTSKATGKIVFLKS